MDSSMVLHRGDEWTQVHGDHSHASPSKGKGKGKGKKGKGKKGSCAKKLKKANETIASLRARKPKKKKAAKKTAKKSGSAKPRAAKKKAAPKRKKAAKKTAKKTSKKVAKKAAPKKRKTAKRAKAKKSGSKKRARKSSRKMVGAHAAARLSCKYCGKKHTLSQHWSHAARAGIRPKKGTHGNYRRSRGLTDVVHFLAGG